MMNSWDILIKYSERVRGRDRGTEKGRDIKSGKERKERGKEADEGNKRERKREADKDR